MSQKTCWGVSADREWPAWAILRFKGFGVIACEPNANAPCDWKLIVQLKEKEEVYAASQMEDGSIKESSSDNFIEPLSDFLQINDRIGPFNAKYGKILLTVSTKDGKNKTYAVKDVNVKNDNELEFILGPGPDPNDVPFSNMAEEMGVVLWFSGDQRLNPSLWSYVNWKLEIPGFSVYNASEDSLEIKWSDAGNVDVVFTGDAPAFVGDVAAFLGAGDVPDLVAPLFAGDAPGVAGGFATFARAGDPWKFVHFVYWVQVQIVNEEPIVVSGIDSKGKEVSMVRKVSGYKVEKDKLMLVLSSKGLKAKSGDREAIGALRESSSGKYRNVRIRSFIYLALGFSAGASFGGTSRYSYSAPTFLGVMRRGKDGRIRVAFKAGKEKAFKYDKQTEVISSMDVGDVITKAFGSEEGWWLMRLKRKLESESDDDEEPCLYPYAPEKCGLPIWARITGLKKTSNDTWTGIMYGPWFNMATIGDSGRLVELFLSSW